jgi:hypothetical protein
MAYREPAQERGAKEFKQSADTLTVKVYRFEDRLVSVLKQLLDTFSNEN